MSYLSQAKLAADQTIIQRVTACAVSEGLPDPSYWAQAHAWQLSAQPGWADAYAAALAEQLEDPGALETVISDEMILTAVRALTSPAE